MSTVLEGTATGLITNFTADLLCSLKKKWSVKDKKKRLEEALILIHCFLDAIKGRIIRNQSLKRWIQRLKKAAEQGDRALKMVKRLLICEKKSKAAGFSFLSGVFSTVAFAKKVLRGGGDAVIKKVDLALEELESACRNLQFFLRLIELDGSSKKADFSVRRLGAKANDKRTKGTTIRPAGAGNAVLLGETNSSQNYPELVSRFIPLTKSMLCALVQLDEPKKKKKNKDFPSFHALGSRRVLRGERRGGIGYEATEKRTKISSVDYTITDMITKMDPWDLPDCIPETKFKSRICFHRASSGSIYRRRDTTLSGRNCSFDGGSCGSASASGNCSFDRGFSGNGSGNHSFVGGCSSSGYRKCSFDGESCSSGGRKRSLDEGSCGSEAGPSSANPPVEDGACSELVLVPGNPFIEGILEERIVRRRLNPLYTFFDIFK